MEKKTYEQVDMEIVVFDSSDVIATSGIGQDPEETDIV